MCDCFLAIPLIACNMPPPPPPPSLSSHNIWPRDVFNDDYVLMLQQRVLRRFPEIVVGFGWLVVFLSFVCSLHLWNSVENS